RLENPVREAKREHVLDRLLAEVVVDPEDLLLAKVLEQRRRQPLRGFEVVAERLLDHQPCPALVVAPLFECLDDGGIGRRRHREIEDAVPAELLVRQVAGGAEDDKRAGIRRPPQSEALGERVLLQLLRGRAHCSGLFSRWPPKPFRIAERTRLPHSASPREAKRSNSEAASTG